MTTRKTKARPWTSLADTTALADRVRTLLNNLRNSNEPLIAKHGQGLDCTSYTLAIRVCARSGLDLTELLQNAVADQVFQNHLGLTQNKFDLQPHVVFETLAGPLDHMPASVGETIWRFWERNGKINRNTQIELGNNPSAELRQRIATCQASRGWMLAGAPAG